MVSKGGHKFQKGNKAAVGNSGPPPVIWTEDRAKVEAKNLLEYAQNEDSLTLLGFYAQSDSVDHVSSAYMERYPVWQEAKRKAKAIIGSRRERGALLGKLDTKIVCKAMGMYDHDLKSYEIEMKKAQNESEGQHPISVRIVDYSK